MAKFKGAILSCKECGKEFKVPPVRSTTAKYCSKECADGHRGPHIDKVEKTCLRCGVVFYSHPCHAERRKFCSYECVNLAAVKEETRFAKSVVLMATDYISIIKRFVEMVERMQKITLLLFATPVMLNYMDGQRAA